MVEADHFLCAVDHEFEPLQSGLVEVRQSRMGLSHGIQVDEVHVFTSEEILEFLDHAFRRALALVQYGL